MGFKTATQRRSSNRASRPSARTASSTRSRPPGFHLQRVIGNSATRRLFRAGLIQPKLTVSDPGDASEREADRVAGEVMRMPEPQPGLTVQRSPLSIQRKCANCKEELKSQPLPDEEEKTFQAKPADSSATPEVSSGLGSNINSNTGSGAVPPMVHEVLRSPGQPLNADTRAFFEPRFGRDLSEVRVHTDARAAESARDVNARAYTSKRQIVFANGDY